MAIPPGGGGKSPGGRDPGPVMRGGGRFTPVAIGGPPDGTKGFSILKWNCKKNCVERRKGFSIMLVCQRFGCNNHS